VLGAKEGKESIRTPELEDVVAERQRQVRPAFEAALALGRKHELAQERERGHEHSHER